jgi:hypothetical protein
MVHRGITVRILLTGVVALLIGLASWSPAQAATHTRPYISTASADMFWCTSKQDLCTTQTVTRNIPKDTEPHMVCWRDDRNPFDPNGTGRWFYSWLDNGQEGYLWSAQVAGQVPTPNCSNINWIRVADWAIGRDNGSYKAWRSKEQDGPNSPDYRAGGYYWSGFCLMFARDDWNMAGNVPMASLPAGSAIKAWNTYKANGQVDVTRRPPRGAMVFFQGGSWDPTLGHVGISLGNWRVVSTDGGYWDTLPIHHFSHSNTTPGYLGWVMPTEPTVPQDIG